MSESQRVREAEKRTSRADGTPDDYLYEAAIYDTLWAELNELDLPFLLARAEKFGGPLLELACGTGRVLLPCAAKVERAVGIDRSPSMLKEARANLKAAGIDEERVDLVEGDLRTFELGQRFPLILAGGQPMFHLPTDDDWLATLQTVRRHLAPGGTFVAGVPVFTEEDIRNYDRRYLFSGEVRHPETNRRIAMWDFSTFDTDKQTITRRRVSEVLDEEGVVLERQHGLRVNFYRFPDQIRALLNRAGFRITREFGAYDESPYSTDSEYFIWEVTAED
ncbi:class I SAM-dependent methyltransferase [Micromonospora ureilytica]|uniref:SAM-dependent methyltransferase n=1 Tax=Micromonospora ureilytica TaxID=709868 RepID=A0ABS0JRH7_9ACTN|nr:class I SAM-dependent methyltransferase [Micromonospora ureilytica]MBG6069649.1 SAM-dependent methyltransferase [Micromonospora ureilytica]